MNYLQMLLVNTTCESGGCLGKMQRWKLPSLARLSGFRTQLQVTAPLAGLERGELSN